MAERTSEPQMDPAGLYREEVFTDRKIGTVRRLTPVTSEGATDSSRPVLYLGDAQVLTQVGTLPLSFDIPAQSLEEAVSKFGAAAKQAIDRAMQELQEMRRQAASSIVVPQGGVPGGGGLPGGSGPMGPGGLPGGGKLKLP